MKLAYLNKLNGVDNQMFSSVCRSMGFASAACYRVGQKTANMLLSSLDDTVKWPASLSNIMIHVGDDNNTSPNGFMKPKLFASTASKEEKLAKGVYLYFPEQALLPIKLVFTLKCAEGKRVKVGTLDGGLEALSSRLHALLDNHDAIKTVSQKIFSYHMKSIGSDLRNVIDHELRTPLSSVIGYLALLNDLNPQTDLKNHQSFLETITTQASYAMEALQKLSLSLKDHSEVSAPEDIVEIDAAFVTKELCLKLMEHLPEYVGENAAKKTRLKFFKASDHHCFINANPDQFKVSMWEVLKNAVIHSRNGNIEILIYKANDMVAIDICDDGIGVSLGSEELIFLRYYQDPATHVSRKGKRGLGLGLFLARQIAEQHFGQLTYVRGSAKTQGFFRFLWPLAKSHQIEILKGA
jgi:two-component system, OmpR family, sensor histidine kinase VanS